MLRTLNFYFKLLVTAIIAGAFAIIVMVYYYSRNLPNYAQLVDYFPPSVTRIYSSDGKLIEEYALEHRVFVPITAVPVSIKEAFIVAEDKNFYEHPGLDITGILRAVLINIVNILQNKPPQGGSTITQQVVKNFFLTNERSIERKIKEAILSYMMSQTFSKERILELYLNQIYLGRSSYGIITAAQAYFNKSIYELNLSETAFLAGLPKAPSVFNPDKNYGRAKERRDYVISRMLEEGCISKEVATKALATELVFSKKQNQKRGISAGYYAEKVREEVITMVGKDKFYQGGFTIITAMDSAKQIHAQEALRQGVREFDRKRGFRGKIKKVNSSNWLNELNAIEPPAGLLEYQLAAVLKVENSKVQIGLKDNVIGEIALADMLWAKTNLKSAGELLHVGDVVAVEQLPANKQSGNKFALRQIPIVNGAIMVIDVNTGQVLAECGGYDFNSSKFNRARQALRQPGSLMKTFVYLSALEHNIPPNYIFADAPIEISQGEGMPLWRPKNYKGDFLGEITMREALEKSRNLVTVRIAQKVGIDSVMEIVKRFEINQSPSKFYSMVLGSVETTLEKMISAYATLGNAGYQVKPQYIELIKDRNGMVIYRRDKRVNDDYIVSDREINNAQVPSLSFYQRNNQVTDENSAYQITSLLQGVVERGTARGAKKIGKVIAGKTGTTNQSMDTWFIGFTPRVAVGAYIGFDTPKTLGKSATGATVALPIVVNFMNKAYQHEPSLNFVVPSGIVLKTVDYRSGIISDDGNGITEAFKKAGVVNSFVPKFTPNEAKDDIFDIVPSLHEIEAFDKSDEIY